MGHFLSFLRARSFAAPFFHAPYSETRRHSFLALLAALPAAALAQVPPDMNDTLPSGKREEARLPNGKKQSEEILKAEHQKNLQDTRELAQMANSLREDVEKDDRFILSLATLKKLDDIEKMTRRIRSRLKRY